MANEREKRRASGLIIVGDLPRKDQPRPFVCRVHTPDGPCAARFASPDALAAHARACARENEELIRANSPRLRNPMMYDKNFWDAEVDAHYRELGKRMEEEGRIIPHKHERAGGS